MSSIRIKLWQLQEWQRLLPVFSRGWWDSPCVQKKEVSLERGQAIIFMGHEPTIRPVTSSGEETPAKTPPLASTPVVEYKSTPIGECPTRPFDQFLAHVYLGDTMAEVSAPLAERYNPLEDLEAIVRGLQQRSAGE